MTPNPASEALWFWCFVFVATLFLAYGAMFFLEGRWFLGSLEWFAAAGWYFNAYWRSRAFHAWRRAQ